MRRIPPSGALVAWWDGARLDFGVVAGEEKQRVRLVLRGGRETRVTAARLQSVVEPSGPVPGRARDQLLLAGERVEAAGRRVDHRASTVDVPLIWELANEAGPAAGLDDLALLALDASDGEARTVLIQAFQADGVHFQRKGEDWLPRPAEQVEALRREQARVGQLRDETDRLLEAVRRAVAGEGFRSVDSAVERKYLDALRQLAIHEESVPESTRAVAVELLEASGVRRERPHEGAFRLLRLLGRFDDDDENLQIERYGLRTRFPDEVLEQAVQSVAAGYDGAGRVDLTPLEPITIDGPTTTEIDDALTLEPLDDGGARLGVHIADPSAFIEPGDPVDVEAFTRAVTHYFPERKLTMLPPVIAERAASLVEGEDRPALSFLVDLAPGGEVAGTQLLRSVVRSRLRLDYDRADAMIADGQGAAADTLRRLAGWGEARQAQRLARGAIVLQTPDVDPRVDERGRVRIERLEGASVSRTLVTEAMILAGEVAAEFCRSHSLPALYRCPSPAAGDTGPTGRVIEDPVEIRQSRRGLRRSQIGTQPGVHASLGLEAYVQATSPLRRYQDLAMHRQIASFLAGDRQAYDAEEMQRIAATTDQADLQARRAERVQRDFWMLRYLESSVGGEIDAVVLAIEHRPVILLVDVDREQPMAGLSGVEPGDRVRVVVEHVNPRAGVLILRPR